MGTTLNSQNMSLSKICQPQNLRVTIIELSIEGGFLYYELAVSDIIQAWLDPSGVAK
jgi:hypothetical protein